MVLPEVKEHLSKRLGWSGFKKEWIDGLLYFYFETKNEKKPLQAFKKECIHHYCKGPEDWHRMALICKEAYQLLKENED